LAGDDLPRTGGSPEATTPSRRTEAIGRRLARAGLNRDLAAAAFAPLVAAVATLWLVIPTLAPGVLSWDTAEFQTVAPVLGTGHPTGYPAYVILGFIASHLLPFGDPAYRMNLLNAILAAGAVAAVVAIIQMLTNMRWVALASGLLFLIMPTLSPAQAGFPDGYGVTSTPLLWQIATHADYHMLHLALVALLFLLLLVWERWRTGHGQERRRRADRWLVAAAFVYGVAFANHGLAWLLPPAIALFVLAVAPRIVLQWRLILGCAAVLAATIVILFLELPIRAAMGASQVYGNPDTWAGFQYVVLAQQFGGSLIDPLGNLSDKYAAVLVLLAGWLGALGYLAVIGLGTSLVRRPRFVLLSVISAAVTADFAASYANAELDRYFLVPLFVAFLYVGFGLADALQLGMWLVASGQKRLRSRLAAPATATLEPSADVPRSALSPDGEAWNRRALLIAEIVAAVVLVVASVSVVPARQALAGSGPGAVSESDMTENATWMHSVLAPPDQGGVAENAVIVSWWSASTTLWYGQRVEGLRPDVLIVDDSNRVDNGVTFEQVTDVFDKYLGKRPVYTIRTDAGDPVTGDGIPALCARYVIDPCQPYVLNKVTARK
jgi:hypothetical protein